jgi:archaellin
VGVGVAAVAAAGLIGYAVHEQRKPNSAARRAVARVRRRRA